MSILPHDEHTINWTWHGPLMPIGGSGWSIDEPHELAPPQAGWHIETRPQKDCVFRVLASARRGNELVEAGGQWEQDALENLLALLKRRCEGHR